MTTGHTAPAEISWPATTTADPDPVTHWTTPVNTSPTGSRFWPTQDGVTANCRSAGRGVGRLSRLRLRLRRRRRCTSSHSQPVLPLDLLPRLGHQQLAILFVEVHQSDLITGAGLFVQAQFEHDLRPCVAFIQHPQRQYRPRFIKPNLTVVPYRRLVIPAGLP